MKYLTKSILPLVVCLLATAVPGAVECPSGTEPYCSPASDPLEPMNRAFEKFNAGLNGHVVHPLSKCYNFIVPKCVRTGIGNFTDNLAYPLRLVKNCLQGNWSGAADETRRFTVNSTAGLLGIMDVAGKVAGIQPCEEDFGQTMAYYGAGPGIYLHLPFLGPTTLRDGVGDLMGIPFNIGRWAFPGEYSMAISAGGFMNGAFGRSLAYKEYFSSNYDTYPLTRVATVISREAQVRNFQFQAVDEELEQSFGFLLLSPEEEDYFDRARTHHVTIDGAGSSMPYSFWPAGAKGNGRVLVIMPGLGGHRLSSSVSALAESFNKGGWSVISFSSTMQPEVFNGFSSRRHPGDFRADAADMDRAVELALADVARRYGGTDGRSCTLLGYSLGAINSLFMASCGSGRVAYDRILAVNPPRNPVHALQTIDAYFAIPEAWGDDCNRRAREVFQRIAGTLLSKTNTGVAKGSLPLTIDESKFLIGLSMRFSLVDLLTDSLMRGDAIEGLDRDATLADKLSFAWNDYVTKVVMPEFMADGKGGAAIDELVASLSIDALEKTIAEDPRIRLFHNDNDFLASEGDMDWYKGILGERAVILHGGSHLGNMYLPEYRKMLLDAAE